MPLIFRSRAVPLAFTLLASCVGAEPDQVPPTPLAPDDDALAADPDEPDRVGADCPLLDKIEIIDGLIVYEDDMVIGRADEPGVFDRLCTPGARGIGINAGAFGANRWPGGVVRYRIDPTLPQPERVDWAIIHWEAKTNIRFERVGDDPGGDYITFKNHNDACLADVGRVGGEQFIRLSTGKGAHQIVGMSINKDDRVYTWYDDGMVTVGTSSNLEAYTAQYPYTLPPGRTPSDIVEIAIHPTTQRVYAYYADYTYSIGTSNDLDAHEPPNWYVTPVASGLIKGIDFGPDATLYTWYELDGQARRMLGVPGDLASGGPPAAVEVPDGQSLLDTVVGMAIAPSSSRVYTWYLNKQASTGNPTHLDVHAPLYSYRTPGHCDFSATVHEIGHAMGLRHEHTRCDRGDHVRVFYDNIPEDKKKNFYRACTGSEDIGVYDKESIMHYTGYQFSKNDRPTLLFHPEPGDPEAGVEIIGSAISSDDQVYTWWSDQTVTSGTSTNLESRRARYGFTLPPPDPATGYVYEPSSIIGIAIAKNTDRVYTWYANGKVSVGTTDNLDAYEAPYTFASPFALDTIRGIAIANNGNTVYTWAMTGGGFRGARGHSDDLSAVQGPYVSSFHPGHVDTDIRGIAISSKDRVYTWYDDGRLTIGNSSDLDADTPSAIAIRGRGIPPEDNMLLSNGDVETIGYMYP